LNTKFHLYSLKVSGNAKIAMQCFQNFGGIHMPQMLPPWSRLGSDNVSWLSLQFGEQVKRTGEHLV